MPEGEHICHYLVQNTLRRRAAGYRQGRHVPIPRSAGTRNPVLSLGSVAEEGATTPGSRKSGAFLVALLPPLSGTSAGVGTGDSMESKGWQVAKHLRFSSSFPCGYLSIFWGECTFAE